MESIRFPLIGLSPTPTAPPTLLGGLWGPTGWSGTTAPAPPANTCPSGPLLFAGLLDLLIRAQCAILDPEENPKTQRNPLREYDFVIVGGGSAGCVLANRLSENSNWRILLLEAGGDEPTNARIPGFVETLWDTDIDWGYRTVPQNTSCLGREGRVCTIPRGKALGGSSVINRMKYVRGNRRDYDAWAAAGNGGWSYKDVLPYFLKSEDNGNPRVVEKAFHSFGGPLRVERFVNHSRLADAILNAGREIGYKANVDVNGRHQMGFLLAQTTSLNGTRFSAARAFLRPARHRKNLHVIRNALAERILLDSSGEKAVGVRYVDSEGITREVFAEKEVLVSCGSIATPQLLMLSGIGPGEHLRSLGIPVVHDLRVGDNLQDHVGLQVPFEIEGTSGVGDVSQLSVDFLLRRKGPLTSTGLSQTVAFVSATSEDSYYPDVQMYFADNPALCAASGGTVRCEYNDVSRGFHAIPVLLRPKSRGTVRLASTDPRAPPLIDTKYLSDRADMRVLMAGVRVAQRIGKTRSLAKLGVVPSRSVARGCEDSVGKGSSYWECAARRFTVSVCHAVGTAKMGPHGDSTAVVDHRLRVYGVKNLRVVDASVMPLIPSGNTNAPTIMIAEKAADMIKQSWRIYG